MRDRIALRQLQALPLDAKILIAQQRIRQWYNYFHGDVYISFSGGKDSTVLAHLVHDMYPNVPMVFSNTGLEYPEIRKFAEQCGAQTITPRMTFDKVISKYGYPVISKEVAEAIHYARKIINPSENIEGGGTATQERRRQEIRGTRDDTERIRSRNESNSTGNGRGGAANRQESILTELRNGDARTSQTRSRTSGNSGGGGGYSRRDLRRIRRFRKQLLGK